MLILLAWLLVSIFSYHEFIEVPVPNVLGGAL